MFNLIKGENIMNTIKYSADIKVEEFYSKINSPMDVFLTYYFSYRIIDFITSQGDGINTALENHKFVFLKRSNFFNDCETLQNIDFIPWVVFLMK